MSEPLYFDHAASTPVDPRVLAAMLPYFTEAYGNPSAVHAFGRRAEAAVEAARQTVADVLNCTPREVVFTGCGSESDNLAVRGAALALRETRGLDHLVITPIEHEAVRATAHQLRDHYGFQLTELPVDGAGRVSPDDVARALRPVTALVSVMQANNEIGTIEPIAAIAAVCRERGVRLHTDAVQAASQLDVDVQALGVDYLALGAHKFYGPKGVGALFVRDGSPLLPAQTGGSQEGGWRAGTHNVAYIAGLAEALRITAAERDRHNLHFASLRDRLIDGVLAAVPDSQLTGHPADRLPNHASFVFRGVDGNELLMHLDLAGFAASSGSACKTGDPRPSAVLLALGLAPDWALGSLRLTVGRQTRLEDVDALLKTLPAIIDRMRSRQTVGVR